MENLRLNNKPAIKITAYKMWDWGNSTLMNCESDQVYFPKKCIQINEDGTMLVEEWLYNAKVKEGKL